MYNLNYTSTKRLSELNGWRRTMESSKGKKNGKPLSVKTEKDLILLITLYNYR